MQSSTEKLLQPNYFGGGGDRRDPQLSNPEQQQRFGRDENPFDIQQRTEVNRNLSSMSQKSSMQGESWGSFGSSTSLQQQNTRRDENPFCLPKDSDRNDNPFCTPGIVQNPFNNRGPAAASSAIAVPQNQAPQALSFVPQQKENPFELNRHSEIPRREIPPTFQSNFLEDRVSQLSSESGNFFRRDLELPLQIKPNLSRRDDFEDDDSGGGAVIDYGHGQKIPEVFSRGEAESFGDFDDEDDAAGGVTIDYGHGSRAPVLKTGTNRDFPPGSSRGKHYFMVKHLCIPLCSALLLVPFVSSPPKTKRFA
jgi:hypothetical protein